MSMLGLAFKHLHWIVKIGPRVELMMDMGCLLILLYYISNHARLCVNSSFVGLPHACPLEQSNGHAFVLANHLPVVHSNTFGRLMGVHPHSHMLVLVGTC